MRQHISTALRLTFVLLVLLCVLYPAAVWGVGQVAFREEANGSLVVRDGRVIGSSLIGQTFTGERFFHPRLSAAGSGYDGMASSGSNLGPTSRKLNDRIAQSVAEWKETRPATGVPADAVTASGSGLDPHISPENARAQAARVATANGMTVQQVEQLIASHTEGRFLGIYGEPRVNVLEINLALLDRSVR